MQKESKKVSKYTTKGEQRFINCTLSGPLYVYVRDGKIVRMVPLPYSKDDAKPWSIEARGETFTRPNKAAVSCWVQGSKQYVYSKHRLLTPLKRVDFDPDGKRNPQNRGKSGYEPIPWDEAVKIVTKEIIRIKEQHGPSAIAVTGSSHDSWGNIGYRMSALERFWNLVGCTWIDHNPESWEGFFWGAIHQWGYYWRLGQPPAYDLLDDTFKSTDMIVFWGSDPSTTSGDYAWNETDNWRFHMKKLGIKFVFIDPFCNYTNVIGGDKWLKPRPGTDCALALAIAFVWITEGLYDKGYVKTHTHGFDQWKAYVLGEEDGVPKTPQWAEEVSGVKARDTIALAREWAAKRTTLAAGGRSGMGHPGRAAFGHEWARMMVLLIAMQGLGKPGVNMFSTTGGAPADWDFYFPGYADGGISGGSSGPRELGPRGFPDRPVQGQIRQRINRSVFPEAVMDPPVSWTEPRCVQTCPTGCLNFGDLDDPKSKVSKLLNEMKGEFFHPEFEAKPNVYYIGLPKPHLSGTVINGDKDQCAGNVTVTLMGQASEKRKIKTDCFGDFAFDGLENKTYTVQFDARGYEPQTQEVTIKDDLCYLGEVILGKAK